MAVKDKVEEKKPAQEIIPAAHTLPAVETESLREDAGLGGEDVTVDDLARPIWRLLQSGSPETKRQQPEYIPGAQEGMWLDTTTKEIFSEIVFVCARFRTEYIEWHPRTPAGGGGGFVAHRGFDKAVMKETKPDAETGHDLTKDGTEIVPTHTWYGVVVGGKQVDGTPVEDICRPAILTFVRTQQKPSRNLLGDMRSTVLRDDKGKFEAPLYYMSYLLTSLGQKNDQGAWSILAYARNGPTKHVVVNAGEAIAKAKEIHRWTKTNVADYSQSSNDAGGGQNAKPKDDDIPF